MPRDLTDDKSTLGQVMAWCRQATSHYLSQCWLSSLSPYGVARPQWVNLLCTGGHIYEILHTIELFRDIGFFFFFTTLLENIDDIWWATFCEGLNFKKFTISVAFLPSLLHDDVIKWKHLPRYWPFVRGIHRSPVNFPHKGQWSGALKFSLICAWINTWVNNCEAGDLRRHRARYDVIVMCSDWDSWKHLILWGTATILVPDHS